MNGVRGGVLAVVVLGLVVASTVAVADTNYALSGSPAIEIPTETVTFEGQTYTLNSVSRIASGESVTVTTSVPDGASYDLNLRGPDNQLISSESLTGDASNTFSFFGSGEAGTYAATIQDDGSTVAVHPIVIAGYDITVDDPGSVAAGGEVTVTASVTERDVERHSSLDTVQVIVGNEDVQAVQELTADDDGSYTGTISTADIEPDTYNVYAVVRGDEEVRQRAELLGVSETVSLTVESGETATDSETGGAGGGGGEPTTTETSTPMQTDTPTATSESSMQTATPAEPTTTDNSDVIVISTSDGTETPTTATDADGPGFTAVLAVIAFLAIASLLARQD